MSILTKIFHRKEEPKEQLNEVYYYPLLEPYDRESSIGLNEDLSLIKFKEVSEIIEDDTPWFHDFTVEPYNGWAVRLEPEDSEIVSVIEKRVQIFDPVVEFFKYLQFEDVELFRELDECDWNQEKYKRYFSYPDLFVFRNMLGILNGLCMREEFSDAHTDETEAFKNMLKWMMVKIATHPYWFQRLGWMNRFLAAHTVPTSYWPVRFSPFFVPNNWKSMHDDWSIKKVNDEGKPFEDIFKWETNEERLNELLEVAGKDWILEQLENVKDNE